MSNEQQELLDEVYENYLQHYDDEYNEEQKKIQKNPLHWMEMRYTNIRPYPKEMFINKCKTDPEFSERWGLKIDEKELSEGERGLLLQPLGLDPLTKEGRDRLWKENNLPTKIITITYNYKTIESYK
jgi:hypothetical protein